MLNLILLIKRIVTKISEDRIGDYASSACYYLMLSFFPFFKPYKVPAGFQGRPFKNHIRRSSNSAAAYCAGNAH